jgi:pimeloyl-ACP methyl ester carboxylesterase
VHRAIISTKGTDVLYVAKSFKLSKIIDQSFKGQRKLGEAIPYHMTINNPLPMTEVGYKNQWNALSKFNSLSWLNKIKIPVKIIAGECDIISTVAESTILAKEIPNANLSVIAEVGHASQIEKPMEFVKILEDFFIC